MEFRGVTGATGGGDMNRTFLGTLDHPTIRFVTARGGSEHPIT